MIQRRKVIFGAIGAAAAATVAGCSTTGKGGGDKAASWVGSAAEAAVPPVQLTVTPAAGNTGVSPVKPGSSKECSDVQCFFWTDLYGLSLCVCDRLYGKNVFK